MDEKGILRISMQEQEEITAVAVRFLITIEGEKLFFGSAALHQSQAVRRLLDALKQLGMSEEQVTVKGVTSQTSSGFFGKDSRCVYRLSIRLDDLAKVPEYLGTIATQPTAQSDIEWIFNIDEARTELACKAMKSAQAKAERMADAIGQRLAGIKICTDGTASPGEHLSGSFQVMAPQSRAAGGSAEIGMEYRATTMAYASVTIEFFISPKG